MGTGPKGNPQGPKKGPKRECMGVLSVNSLSCSQSDNIFGTKVWIFQQVTIYMIDFKVSQLSFFSLQILYKIKIKDKEKYSNTMLLTILGILFNTLQFWSF